MRESERPTAVVLTVGSNRVRTIVENELGRWASDWNDLVAASPVPSPFLRSWWIDNAAKGTQVIVLVVQGDELLGGFAAERRRYLGVPVLAAVGAGALCPDHVDLVARSGSEDVVHDAIATWMRRRGNRIIDFEGVPEQSLMRLVVPRARAVPHDLAPYIELRTPGEQFIASRPPIVRQTIVRARKRLQRDQVLYRRISDDPAEVAKALERLTALHAAQWSTASQFLRSVQRFCDAAVAGARAGEVTVHELVAGEIVVASMVTFDDARRSSFYQSARLVDRQWRSAGTVLLANVVEWVADRAATELDLLRGDEDYKAHWATDTRTLWHVSGSVGFFAGIALAGLRGQRAMRRFGGKIMRANSTLRTWSDTRRTTPPRPPLSPPSPREVAPDAPVDPQLAQRSEL